MSCASLSSASSFGLNSATSFNSEVSQEFSTAPTSVAGSPGPSTPSWEFRPRARTLSSNLPSSVALPNNLRPNSPLGSPDSFAITEADEYFPCQATVTATTDNLQRRGINFWNDMPSELRIQILSFLTPKEIVQASAVSKAWHNYCFDGQLWRTLDVSDYYRDIPAEALVKIISTAGPFVRDLNLRGCVQLREKWSMNGLVESCQNVENFSLEGCLIDRASVHCFLLQNPRLVHINVSGLPSITNAALKIIGQHCPKLELLNITWCQNVDTRGIKRVLDGCPNLKDLRAGEVRGWEDVSFALELHRQNKLERLVLTNCDTLSDDSLAALIIGKEQDGKEPETDWLTGRYIVPPRALKHLDLTKCKTITDEGFKLLAHNLPLLEGLQISKCTGLTDTALIEVLPTFPNLTHLDLEELDTVSNEALQAIATSPAAITLRHLSISYCEAVTDAGMVPFIKACRNLEQIDMDNTRVSDLCLIEAAASIRERNRAAAREYDGSKGIPGVLTGLKLIVYDCPNVTWMGVREVLSRNAELAWSPPVIPPSNVVIPPAADATSLAIASLKSHAANHAKQAAPSYPHTTISLKAFYTWQPTINEHAKRINACEFHRARRLERKWAEYMMCGEEANHGGRRRRRRMREALEAMAGEESDTVGNGGIGRRRRARSAPLGGNGGCSIM
jgi:F-box/leucine-rich repeat protein 2/20